MRLRWLHLQRFGHFEDVRLDFAAPGPAFHLIYGPNEAGKSTTLRAIHGLLYGVPLRSPDTHTHGSDLRVAASLIAGDEESTFIRRKGNKNTLLAADGTAVPEEALQRFLHHTPQATFSSLYGLNHETLRAGAEALLTDGGHLGQSLFEAGIGGRGVRLLLQSLRADAKALFSPRGKNPLLNDAIAKYRESQQRVLTDGLRVDVYRELEQELDSLRSSEEKLRSQRRGFREERARLERARRVLPLLSLLHDVQRRLSILGDVPRLPEDASMLREQAQIALAHAEPALKQEQRELDNVSARLAQITIPESLSELDPQSVVVIRDRLGNFRKALQEDLPRARSSVRSLRAEAQRILRRLGLPEKLTQAHESRLSTAERARVQGLLRSHSGLLAACERSEVRLSLIQKQIVQLQGELAQDPQDPQDPQGAELGHLQRVVERARAQLRLVEQRRGLMLAVSQQEAQLAAVGQRCGLWLRDGEALATLQAPRPASARELTQLAERLQQQEAVLAQDEAHAAEREARLRTDLDTLERTGEVPTEGELLSRRQARDGLLRDVEAKPTAAAWGVVHEAVRGTDALADRMRFESGRMAEASRLQAELASEAQKRKAQAARRAQHRSAQASLAQRLEQFLSTHGLRASLSATEALAAAEEMEQFGTVQQALREAQAQLSVLKAEGMAVVAELDACLGTSAVDGTTSPATWSESLIETRLRSVEDALARQQAALTERVAAQRQLRDAKGELLRVQHEHDANCAALEKWQTGWNEAMGLLRLPPNSAVEQAQAVLDDLSDLFSKLDEVEGIDKRLEQMTQEQEGFTKDVFRLRDAHLYRLGMGNETEHADDVAEELIRAYERAQRDIEQQRQLRKERQARAHAVANLSVECEQARKKLEHLCAQARVQTPAELQAVEQRAVEAGRLERELRQTTKELLDAAGGASIEAIGEEVRGVNADAVSTRLAELEQELERLESALEAATRNVVAKEKALEQLRGAEGAAAAAGEAAAHLTVCRDHAQHYVRLRLAEALLEREIARYRERHQHPVLNRASNLFARLTCGRYIGLDADFDDSDEPTLTCRRADGSRTTVEGLSDGTRDPLYLALRLSTLERYGADVLPLCLDDILIHADDERARAGLTVLHEFAQHTQVLFFTHHDHLRQLAEDCLGAGLYVHQLPGPRVIGTPSAAISADVEARA